MRDSRPKFLIAKTDTNEIAVANPLNVHAAGLGDWNRFECCGAKLVDVLAE